MISLYACNNEEKSMRSVKEAWMQLVSSTTVNEEIEAIHRLRKMSKKHSVSFALYMIEPSGKKIHYNAFKNQKIESVSVDFQMRGSEFTLDKWKPIDIHNVSLFFME